MAKTTHKGLSIHIPQGGDESYGEYIFETDNTDIKGIVIFPENPVFGDIIKIDILLLDNSLHMELCDNLILTSKVSNVEILSQKKDESIAVTENMKIRIIYTAIDENGRDCSVLVDVMQ